MFTIENSMHFTAITLTVFVFQIVIYVSLQRLAELKVKMWVMDANLY